MPSWGGMGRGGERVESIYAGWAKSAEAAIRCFLLVSDTRAYLFCGVRVYSPKRLTVCGTLSTLRRGLAAQSVVFVAVCRIPPASYR